MDSSTETIQPIVASGSRDQAPFRNIVSLEMHLVMISLMMSEIPAARQIQLVTKSRFSTIVKLFESEATLRISSMWIDRI